MRAGALQFTSSSSGLTCGPIPRFRCPGGAICGRDGRGSCGPSCLLHPLMGPRIRSEDDGGEEMCVIVPARAAGGIGQSGTRGEIRLGSRLRHKGGASRPALCRGFGLTPSRFRARRLARSLSGCDGDRSCGAVSTASPRPAPDGFGLRWGDPQQTRTRATRCSCALALTVAWWGKDNRGAEEGD